MTDAANPYPPGIDCWVDFNDIHDGQVTALRSHVAPYIPPPLVGGLLRTADHEGNRALARVTAVDEAAVQLHLLMDTFLTIDRAGRYEIRAALTDSPETMYEQAQRGIASVHALGSQHRAPLRTEHTEPVVGCPECVDQERAETLFKRMAERWPDEWPALTLYEARVLCARGDLARSKP